MTWNELYNQIPPEHRDDPIHILDEESGVLDWGNVSLKKVSELDPIVLIEPTIPTEQYVLVFEC